MKEVKHSLNNPERIQNNNTEYNVNELLMNLRKPKEKGKKKQNKT